MPPPEGRPPRVSVVMPSFNHEKYVESSIRSVLSQTYPNVELIVVDDASTDATADLVDRLSREFGFLFVRNDGNMGLNATLEKAISLSRGDFMSMLASDDQIAPTKIEDQVGYLLETGNDAVFSAGYKLWDDGSTELIPSERVEALFRRGHILQHTYCDDTVGLMLQSALLRRNAMVDLFHYRRQFKSDDWVMTIKLLETYRVGFLNKPLFYYRQHPLNSYRKYWSTLPMRLEVVAHATPESMRARAVSNVFLSHALYLWFDNRKVTALRFLLASLALSPLQAGSQAARLLTRFLTRPFRKFSRRTKGNAADQSARPTANPSHSESR